MTKKVAVFGGGIAGLTVAHELIERNYLGNIDFEVEVYEGGPGCKALSQFIPGSGRAPRGDLPGEHGFRFFPAYYWHVIDTMSRIPTGDGRYVDQNLIGCDQFALASAREGIIRMPRQSPAAVGSFFDLAGAIKSFFKDLQLSPLELGRFALRMLQYLCSCDRRRKEVFERRTFWTYVDGRNYSPLFQSYINAPRFLVAMQAKHSSARTIGNQCMQMCLDYRRTRGTADRVLNGPTNTAWIDPWLRYLSASGVRFRTGAKLVGFELEGQGAATRIAGARVEGEREPVVADYYVSALPVEQMLPLISDRLADADESLSFLLSDGPNWRGNMSGAQFYLRDEIDICEGHVAYSDSAWGLSSISPVQFWDRGKPAEQMFPRKYGNGEVMSFISVDISDWVTVSPRTGKSAAQCTSAAELLGEVWKQLQDALNAKGALLEDHHLVQAYLDSHVIFSEHGATTQTPLLIHPPGSWDSRPKARTAVGNLFLASDYVRTSTDLATMEGANEAARLAVNEILAEAGVGPPAMVRPLREDAGFLVEKAKALDARRMASGDEKEALPEGNFTIDQVEILQQQLAAELAALPEP